MIWDARLWAAWRALLTPEPVHVVVEHRVLVMTASTLAQGTMPPPRKPSRYNDARTGRAVILEERPRDGWRR